jgi:hypothetical protein
MSHILRGFPGVKTLTGVPVSWRIRSDSNLKELIKNIRHDFVLNMDETGFWDFVDTRIEKVIMPDTSQFPQTEMSKGELELRQCG